MLLLLLAALSVPLAADEVDNRVADRCHEILESSVVAFYLPHCIDTEHGGYLEVLDADGKFVGGEKFLTLQARQLWFFSTLAVADVQRTESLAAAESGYRFLRDHFHDTQHGGYFAKTSASGSPTDRRKHVYPNAFVIYAFVEYYRATGNAEPLRLAMQLFKTLEDHCYDQQYGGYREFFTDDWQFITDASQTGYVGRPGTKTYNSHLHLLEALTPLLRETGDVLVERRLSELVQINTLTVRHPEFACNIDGWQLDWTIIESPKNLRASYGHDMECAWLVLDATEALGRKPASLRTWAKTICDHAILRGRDLKYHGFFYTGPVGKTSDDRRKEWWTQSEVLVAMLTLHQLTGDPGYRKIFDETLDFIEQKQVSKLGGWWAILNEDGSVRTRSVRTSLWQGAYHNGRALLRSEKMLRGE